ncbi:MAG: SAM-dependent methyltransferase, partial [Pseudomonadales bacterium]|nr:SAM-dependent methyltransferase [Pseudomonadales bacterium]
EELAETCGLEITGRGQWGFYWFLWMCFYWASQQESGDDATTIDRIRPPYHPLLQSWSETWTRFMELPETDGMRRALNELMPKSRVIVARRRQER